MSRHPRRPFKVSRRDLLRGTGAAVLGAPFASSLVGCTTDDDPSEVFRHGIASGDPLPDAVILWTRVTTSGAGAVEVTWEIAEDPAMTKRVASGSTTTDAERDYTVKVDATGLQAGQTYYYRFRSSGCTSSRISRLLSRTAVRGSARYCAR